MTLKVSLSNTDVENVKAFKHMGLYVNQNLGFDEHICWVFSKVDNRTGSLGRVRHLISKYLARQLYVSNIDRISNIVVM